MKNDKKSAKQGKTGKTFSTMFIFLILTVVLLLVGVFLYWKINAEGGFPGLSVKNSAQHENAKEPQQEESFSMPQFLTERKNIAGLQPQFFAYAKIDSSALPLLNSFNYSFTEQGAHFTVTDEGYTLECLGANSVATEKNEIRSPKIESWTHYNDYPITSLPGVYGDMIVFVDACPKLVCLDLQTGLISAEFDCPVLPAGSAALIDGRYVFEGRDGNIYVYDFIQPGLLADSTFASAKKQVHAVFLPAKDAQEQMLFRLKEWSPQYSHPALFANYQLFFVDTVPLALKTANEPQLFAFYPPESKSYTLELCNENGQFIHHAGYIALFNAAGQLLMVSLDYASDEPRLHFPARPDTLYYFAACSLSENPTGDSPDMHLICREAP